MIRSIFETLWQLLTLLWNCIESCFGFLWKKNDGSGEVVIFDNGRKVQITRQIAEGGFSVIFSARDCNESRSSSGAGNTTYALKRIICPDEETTKKCREEADIHRAFNHCNLMPLLGFKFEKCHAGEYYGKVCYMLFPLYESSLRDEVTKRNLLGDELERQHPWKERELLEIFAGIVDAVTAMHKGGYAHRDIKLENILLDQNKKPVLMDFGSVGPVIFPIQSRSSLLDLVDEASCNSTVSYRAPELFEGGARYGESDIDGKVDVWSLGCVFFGMMFGASPFECEFRGDAVRIVECSHLRVIGRIPTPPPNSQFYSRYSVDLLNCVNWMLTQERSKRPAIDQVLVKINELLDKSGGKRSWPAYPHRDDTGVGNFDGTIREGSFV
mmetsp:Transcript_1802/g.2701  ORF Transcript_1802/g.2701 Transcript_1802/m.2701 type:complete len:384 (-) Transcript_1802:471-1622(-)|eukprot:CAMPEP_0195526078 /NCGR_PEP_ID=MMETSP0794_2-20130614/26938_1 /TAXON_ID=515487 /ORGANISM="Stephanopyxis turris, Strain CCMP 815" /LENGTH=383 /DNA_ID=CAMNT_0040656693 /DNA_START=142 /DNA_END=1293 /DNA_ORIENTATION=-